VLVHELGHLLGLQHVLGGQGLADPPTMAETVDPWLRSQSLHVDDELTACFLYPAVPHTCSHQCDCPFVLEKDASGVESYKGQTGCSLGECGGLVEVISRQSAAGSACLLDLDCVPGAVCVWAGQAGSYCAVACELDGAPCGEGTACWPTDEESSSGFCMSVSLEEGKGNNVGVCLAGNEQSGDDQWGTYEGGCGCGAGSAGGNGLILLMLLIILHIPRKVL